MTIPSRFLQGASRGNGGEGREKGIAQCLELCAIFAGPQADFTPAIDAERDPSRRQRLEALASFTARSARDNELSTPTNTSSAPRLGGAGSRSV